MLEPDLADEEQHRRRILLRRVDADRGVRGAGAPRHEADPGPAGQLAVGLRHVGGTTLLAAHHEPQAVGDVVEGVENGEVALAGDAEGGVDALRQQAVDEQLPTGAFPCCLHAAHPRTAAAGHPRPRHYVHPPTDEPHHGRHPWTSESRAARPW